MFIQPRTFAALAQSNLIDQSVNVDDAVVNGGKINRFGSSNTHSFIKEKKTSKILDEQSSFMDTPDPNLDQMSGTSFQNEVKLAQLFNGKNKMEFIHCYADLLSYLSYLKLQQAQWGCFHQMGMTQDIWTNRISKHEAAKNSIVHTYGRSKLIIEQYRAQITASNPGCR